jgi:hypothetical protein
MILGGQLARKLVQPCLEHPAVLARFAVAVELGRASPGRQSLLEPGGQFVGTIGQLKADEALPHGFVSLGQFEQDGAQGGWLLSLQESFERFGGCLGMCGKGDEGLRDRRHALTEIPEGALPARYAPVRAATRATPNDDLVIGHAGFDAPVIALAALEASGAGRFFWTVEIGGVRDHRCHEVRHPACRPLLDCDDPLVIEVVPRVDHVHRSCSVAASELSPALRRRGVRASTAPPSDIPKPRGPDAARRRNSDLHDGPEGGTPSSGSRTAPTKH